VSEPTFAFVDLAGYTALTDAHGDEAAAWHVERFGRLAHDALRPRVEFVKSIGDAVMLVAGDALAGLESVEALMAACLHEPDFPIARAGLHQGSAVSRDGDWFGTGVNVAARIAALAAGQQLLVTDAVSRVARDAGRTVRDLGAVVLRGVSAPVGLHCVELVSLEPHSVIDPVCRMRTDTRTAAGRLRYDDRDWWFCSLECARRFGENPAAFIS